MERLTAERIAKNDAAFRRANEQIEADARSLGLETELLPFICECADPECTQIVRLDSDQYAEIRSQPRWFMNVPGHERPFRGAIVVVEQYETYLLVEKTGRAGEIVERLATEDRRAGREGS